jgi:uncharacterized NAD(P)/FAD-binding protein YdhS
LRLNVPAAHMSLDPSRPADFVQFARAHSREPVDPQAFLPRALYGQYVEARLHEAERRSAGQLRVIRGEACAVTASGVRLCDGCLIEAERIVLATGLAAHGGKPELPDDPRIVDAWDEAACHEVVRRNGRTLLLGSGLSALDVFALFEALDRPYELLVVSRHGLLPRPHAQESREWTAPAWLGAAPTELGPLVRWGRAVAVAAEDAGVPWQHALDGLRPELPRLWQGLSPRDRTRFLRHVRSYWEVLRHRAPRDVLEKLARRRARGELSVVAGRVLGCRATPEALELTIRLRGGELHRERAERLVRCLGPALTIDRQSAPLIASLFEAGLATRDPAGLGLATDDYGRLIQPSGRPSDRLFALGQPCQPARWETTSAPEIVRDVSALVPLLASDVRHGSHARAEPPSAEPATQQLRR